MWSASPHRVVRDNGDHLTLAYWPGIQSLAPTTWIEWLRGGDDSIRKQAIPDLARGQWELGRWTWRGTSAPSWFGLDPNFSIHRFCPIDGRPPRWYVNFECPPRSTAIGIDTFDLLLDLAAARWQAANHAPWLDRITRNPQARWLNSPRDLDDVPDLAHLANQRNELLVLVTYYAPNRDCDGPGSGAPTAKEYEAFIDGLIVALGSVRAAIVVEPDAVAAECFDRERSDLLKGTFRRRASPARKASL